MSVLLGNGDGTFQNQVTYAVGSGPDALVTGDFNGDGRTDLAVANYDSTTTCRSCWATATAPSRPRSPTRWGRIPVAIVAGDFTGDGRTDLAVANQDSNDVSILLGNGDGTFQTQVTYAVGSGPRRNRGGRLQRRRPHRPRRRQRVELRQRRVDPAGQRRRHLPAPGHLRGGVRPRRDRGGRLHRRRPHRPRRRQLRLDNDVSMLLGNGDGTFQTQVTYAVGSDPRRHRGGRLQRRRPHRPRRRQLRLATTTCRCCWATATAPSSPRSLTRWGPLPDAIVAGDFTGDGRTDLAVANSGANDGVGAAGQRRRHLPAPGHLRGGVAVPTPSWRATSTATAAPTSPSPTPATTTCRCCWATATAPSSPRSPTRWGPIQTPSWRATSPATAALDLAVANSGSNDVSVLLGNGDGTFADPGQFATTPHATPLVADVNGDGTDDVLVVDGAGNILYRQGIPGQPGTFEPPVTVNPGQSRRATSPGFRTRIKARCSPASMLTTTRSRSTPTATVAS